MAGSEERLPRRVKAGYALGDHAVNVQLAATALFYLFFLTEVAGLRPALAGLVLLVGRGVDAVTDPLMGRLSDATRWRAGRRRPWFLIGAAPFGVTFALLWWPLPLEGQAALFAAYAGLYVANTLASTALAVPYMALLPELAQGYDERTSANTWRTVGVVAGVALAAVGLRPLVEALGGGAAGWSRAGAALGLWVALPWLVVHRVSFERPELARSARIGLARGLRLLARHRAYRRLGGLFLFGRIAVDVVGAMLVFYFTYWLARPDDLPVALAFMLSAVVLTLPLWMRVAGSVDKHALFMVGCGLWVLVQLALLALGPGDPRALVFGLVALAGVGYGVADMLPWSMLGDVIDADELASGERRDGLYAGVFTFLRKLGGALGVAVAGGVLELAGFEAGAAQEGPALWAIRGLTALAPALCLLLAIAVARGYPIGRERHAAIRAGLDARRAAGARSGG